MKTDISLEVKTPVYAPVRRVWEALTKPELIKKYFFNTNTYTNWKPGSLIIFKGEWEGKEYEDKGTILDVISNRLIRYNYWSSMSGIEDKPENYVVITYLLEDKEDFTLLTVRQENIADEKRKQHARENWNRVMNGLKELVEEEEITK